MSTDLKSRSKAYELTRVACRGELGVAVGQGWDKPAVTITLTAISIAFANDRWDIIAPLNLLEESVERLKLDLAQFALTHGNGMEAIDGHVGGNNPAQVLTNLVKFIDFLDGTEGAAPFAGDNRKEWLEHRAAAAKVVAIY